MRVCAAGLWHPRSDAGTSGPARRGVSQLRSFRGASGVGLAPALLVVVRALRALHSLMHQECQNLGACRRPCNACRPALPVARCSMKCEGLTRMQELRT